MQVQGLDGRKYQWRISDCQPDDRSRSQYHLACRDLLKKLYPFKQILEEVPLPGVSAGCTLHADFYVPAVALIVEVQGQQHFKYVAHFHKNRMAFLHALRLDQLKRQWCELNCLRHVAVRFDEDENVWRRKILG